jgi:hypothetical protein
MHSPTIREKLETDARFRGRFLPEIWSSFERILALHSDETERGIYVYDPRVWSFLDEFGERGARLFAVAAQSPWTS